MIEKYARSNYNYNYASKPKDTVSHGQSRTPRSVISLKLCKTETFVTMHRWTVAACRLSNRAISILLWVAFEVIRAHCKCDFSYSYSLCHLQEFGDCMVALWQPLVCYSSMRISNRNRELFILCTVSCSGDGHGLDPSVGWVGSHFPAHVMGWLGLGWMRSTVIFYCILCYNIVC